MKRTLGLVLLAAVAGGCARNVYDIELDPAGNTLGRKLTVRQQSRGDSDGPEAFHEEVNRIAAEYGAAAPRSAQVHVFRARFFSGKLPNDVGGSGSFSHWDTPLGSASMYIERFRGTDDVVGILRRRQASADRLTDLLVAWLGKELQGDPQWPALKQFLNEDLRHDLQNLAVYAWTMHFGKTEEYVEPAMRILQYLVERGYIEPGEIPAFARALSDATRGAYERLLVWGSAFLAARTEGNVPQMPDSLSTPEKWSASLFAFLETTDDFATLKKTRPEKHPGAGAPEGSDVVAHLVAEMFLGGMDPKLGSDQVAVALKTVRPALFMNGQWSAESGKITWPSQALPADGLPAITYAIWDEPNEAGQKSHFGAVVLTGESLLVYCIWYRGLSVAEREEWDRLIDKLGPDSDHNQALRNFRFSHEPVDLAQDERLAGAVIESILKGLKSKR
jgi:hypothetical protein